MAVLPKVKVSLIVFISRAPTPLVSAVCGTVEGSLMTPGGSSHKKGLRMYVYSYKTRLNGQWLLQAQLSSI